MEKSKLTSIFKRIVTALILVPVTIGVLYVGYPFVQLFALLAGTLMAWEWVTMVPNKHPTVYALVYTFVLAVSILTGVWSAYFVCLFLGMLWVWLKAKNEEWRRLLVLGVPYISIGIGSVIWLYELVGFSVTLWFLLIVWCVDIGGYVVGCSLKGPKLAPKISPNKTWSGLLGGVLFSVTASMIFCYFVGAAQHNLFYGTLAAMIAVIAQIGDLVESHIKRTLGLKDSSNLIPGHGGVFDRVDGLIFSAPLVFILFKYALFLM